MPSHITVVPASTKAGTETIRLLLESKSKPVVRGMYRDTSKAPADYLEHSNFKAVKGDVGSGDLDFDSSDTVFYIPPPTYDGTDQGEWGTQTAKNVKNAIAKASSVKKLVLFSSAGAQHDHGIGVLRLNHITDNILGDAVPEVIIVRPGYFHEGWAPLLEETKADPPVLHSWFTPIDYKVPMVSIKDVGECCAKSILEESPKSSPYIFKVFGPRHYSSVDLKKAVDEATGKDVELKAVEKDQLAGFFGQQLPEAHVQDFVDMTTAVLPGGVMAGDFEYDENTVRGKVELVDSIRRLVAGG